MTWLNKTDYVVLVHLFCRSLVFLDLAINISLSLACMLGKGQGDGEYLLQGCIATISEYASIILSTIGNYEASSIMVI